MRLLGLPLLPIAAVVLASCSTSASEPPQATQDAVESYSPPSYFSFTDNVNATLIAHDGLVKLRVTIPPSEKGWVGLALNEMIMPADTIVAYWDANTGQAVCRDMYNPGIPTLPMFPSPLDDTNPIIVVNNGNPDNNVDNVSVASSDAGTGLIECERPMITNDIFDLQVQSGTRYNVFGYYNTPADVTLSTENLPFVGNSDGVPWTYGSGNFWSA